MDEEELFCKLFPEYAVNGKPLSPYFDLFESGYEQSEKQIADLENKLANVFYQLEGREVELKQLQKENVELKAKWLQTTDEGTSWAHRKSLEQENLELKKLIKNIIRVTWGEGWNYSLDWKVKAEAFINKE